MGLLDKFERSVERLMEGTTSSVFRQRLQPAEIGARLERAMLDGQRASVGSSIVPNAFTVHLHPDDYSQIESFQAGLARQMEGHLAHVASQRHMTVLDKITVSFETDDRAKKRSPLILATISDHVGLPPRHAARPERRPTRSAPPPVQHTSVFEVATPAHAAEPHLVGVNGPLAQTRISIREGRSMVGRMAENQIVINEPDVSRIHARLERSGAHVRVYDLNSTNGTRINGEAIHISDIENGDRIRFGGQEFEFWTSHQ